MVLFYDADCGFCQASVNWLAPRCERAGHPLKLVAYQDADAPVLYPAINWTHNDRGIQILFPNGEVRKDARGVAACLRLIPEWRWLGSLMELPVIGFFAQTGYRIVAANRRRISRLLGMNACKIPAR